jgi:hypothetical protein
MVLYELNDPLRPPLNTVETLASTANDMVSWYEAGHLLYQAGDAD